MTPEAIISVDVWRALGWAMLHFLWVGMAVALFFWVAERLLLRRAAPGARYAHGLACLLTLAITAGICIWQQLPEADVPAAPQRVTAPAEIRFLDATPAIRAEASPTVEIQNSVVHETPVAIADNPTVWIEWLPWIWLGGSAMFAFGLMLGLTGIRRLRARIVKSISLIICVCFCFRRATCVLVSIIFINYLYVI